MAYEPVLLELFGDVEAFSRLWRVESVAKFSVVLVAFLHKEVALLWAVCDS